MYLSRLRAFVGITPTILLSNCVVCMARQPSDWTDVSTYPSWTSSKCFQFTMQFVFFNMQLMSTHHAVGSKKLQNNNCWCPSWLGHWLLLNETPCRMCVMVQLGLSLTDKWGFFFFFFFRGTEIQICEERVSQSASFEIITNITSFFPRSSSSLSKM